MTARKRWPVHGAFAILVVAAIAVWNAGRTVDVCWDGAGILLPVGAVCMPYSLKSADCRAAGSPTFILVSTSGVHWQTVTSHRGETYIAFP